MIHPRNNPTLSPLGQLALPCILLTLTLLTQAGCQSTLHTNPTTVNASDYDPIYNAAGFILRKHGFILDRQDHRFGRVSTLPLLSPAFFEPWHNTNSTAQQILTSTTNAQRRTVTINIEPASNNHHTTHPKKNPWNQRHDTDPIPPPNTYRLRVEVQIERFQNPIKHLTGSTSRGYLVARLRENPHEYTQAGIPGSYWQSLGRDTKLEQRLLHAILQKSKKLRQKT